MNRNNLKNLFFSLPFVLMCSSIGYCEKAISDVNDFFKNGDCRDIEVVQPKPGFIGSVPTANACSPHKKVPTSNENFLTTYIRITIVKKIELKNGIRVVFQLDEIDPNGMFVTYYKSREGDGYHEPLYYAYLDVKSGGCKMTGSARAIHDSPKYDPEEPMQEILSRSIRNGIRFPLVFTFPPALNLHENYKDNSWMYKDNGIVYTDAVILNAPYYMRINSSLTQKVYPSMEVEQKDKKYYSDNDKTLSEAKRPDSIEVIILEKETQLWDQSDDWLWLELDRTDNDGNVIIRCRKLNAK